MDHIYQTVITKKNSFADFGKIRETLRYRDLVFLFVKRDFISKYKQTILGPAWAVIQPLMTTIVFTIIFGNLAKLTTADIENGDLRIPGFLFYMIGTICWTYFSSTVTTTSNTFIENRAILGKVYFPRLVMPVSAALSNLISFFIQFFMFAAFLIYYACFTDSGIHFTPMIILIPLLIVQLVLLSTGFGIIISALTTKYRDLRMLVGFGLQLWQYASPIAYGLTLIPARFLSIYMLNPVTPVITSLRCALFGEGYFNLLFYLVSWIITLLIFVLGVLLFNKVERTFMDTV